MSAFVIQSQDQVIDFLNATVKDCLNGIFFHLDCLKYKRMPNNSKSTWICNSCKEKPFKANDVKISTVQSGENITSSLTSLIPSTTCTYSIPQDPCGDVNHSVDYLSEIVMITILMLNLTVMMIYK